MRLFSLRRRLFSRRRRASVFTEKACVCFYGRCLYTSTEKLDFHGEVTRFCGEGLALTDQRIVLHVCHHDFLYICIYKLYFTQNQSRTIT